MKKIAICMSLLLGQVWGLGCSTPVTISEPGLNVSTPKVAINEQGEVLTLWISENPEEKEETLIAATRDGEKQWSSAVISEPAAGIDLRDFYIDAQGNQFVFWEVEKEDSEGDELEFSQFAKKEKNQVWTKAVNVLNPEDKLKYPKMAFDTQGNVLLLSHSEAKNQTDIWRTSYNVVSVFYSHQKGEINKTEIAKIDGYSQHLVKNREGKVFAWWEDTTYTGYQSEKMLKGSWLQDDGSWSTPETLVSFSDSPSLYEMNEAMNSKGDLAMLWMTSASGKAKTIQAATCFNDQWSEPLEVAVSDKDFDYLTLKINDACHIAACWTKTEKGNEIVYVADKPVGQPWSSPIAVSNPTKDVDSYKMSMDDQGNILMVWIVTEGRKEVPYAAYKPVNQEWGDPVRLSEGTRQCSHIKVETNHQGYFVVLWNEVQKKQVSIQGAALSTATKEWTSATISPEGQDCGNFKFAFNKKGQGVIAWQTTLDDEDTLVQVAELNVN